MLSVSPSFAGSIVRVPARAPYLFALRLRRTRLGAGYPASLSRETRRISSPKAISHVAFIACAFGARDKAVSRAALRRRRRTLARETALSLAKAFLRLHRLRRALASPKAKRDLARVLLSATREIRRKRDSAHKIRCIGRKITRAPFSCC